MQLLNIFFFLIVFLYPLSGFTQDWQIKFLDRALLAQGKFDVQQAEKNRGKYLQQEIKRLLIQAEQQLDRMQLTLPKGNNAYETYQQILKLDPSNKEAKQGLVKIGDRYQQLAERYAREGSLQKSLRTIEKGLRVVPDHVGLLVMHTKRLSARVLVPMEPKARLKQPTGGSQGPSRPRLVQERAEAEQQLRQFSWPPPQASATEIIPRELLEAKRGETLLRDVDSKITQALKQTGYYESSYYAVPEGFAIATRIEQIEQDGSPKKEPQRWSLESQPTSFTLAAYLKALFLSTPGYYRVIVFVVTPYLLTQSSVDTTPEEAKKWLSGGHNRLPESIGNMEFLKTYTCTALIYEFERQTESEEPRFRQPGRIPGHTHLVKAGIWQSLEE